MNKKMTYKIVMCDFNEELIAVSYKIYVHTNTYDMLQSMCTVTIALNKQVLEFAIYLDMNHIL